MSDTKIHLAVRDAVARSVAAVGLCAVAVIHLLDTTSKFKETPYMGFMYVGLIASCLVLAGLLIRNGDSRVWAATGVLSAVVMIGFALSRTTGLPRATGDIGNWGEPLGMASLFVEGALVALSAGVLLGHRAAGGVAPSRPRAGGRFAQRGAEPDRVGSSA